MDVYKETKHFSVIIFSVLLIFQASTSFAKETSFQEKSRAFTIKIDGKKFPEKIPMANLFVTMLNQLGKPVEKFADSTGDLADILV